MKRKNISKLLYILAVFLLVVFCVCLGVDYYHYNTTLNSAPFSVWVLVRGVEFGLPAIIAFFVAYFLQRKDK